MWATWCTSTPNFTTIGAGLGRGSLKLKSLRNFIYKRHTAAHVLCHFNEIFRGCGVLHAGFNFEDSLLQGFRSYEVLKYGVGKTVGRPGARYESSKRSLSQTLKLVWRGIATPTRELQLGLGFRPTPEGDTINRYRRDLAQIRTP